MRRIVSVVAARPNFVKLAAVHHALQAARWPEADHVIVHTGQHYDSLLSDVFFQQLQIPMPHHNLEVHGGGQLDQIGRTMEALESLLLRRRPGAVLVYGDVNGAFAAAFVAQRCGIRVAHVEAGLRSFDRSMPEEVNRTLIDHVSTYLFVSEAAGVENLRWEGREEGVLVGNTMIDTLLRLRSTVDAQSLPTGLPTKFGVVTLHRPINVDDVGTLRELLRFLRTVGEVLPLVFPVHPRTRESLDRMGLARTPSSSIHFLDPLPYLTFLKLVSTSACVLTDSGGVQEEATVLGVKCFTLRRSTERPSTIESGANELIDVGEQRDRDRILRFAQSPTRPSVRIPPMWDGRAGDRIVSFLRERLS